MPKFTLQKSMADLSASQKDWISIQRKTFTRWCNSKLQNHPKATKIITLESDFHDGLNLIYLLETLSEKPFPYEYFQVIKYELHCQENISLCIKYLRNEKIKMVNLDFKDIYEGNLKLILALLWRIIKSYDILRSNDNVDTTDSQLKTNLLDWTNKILNQYNMSIKHFGDWRDGKKFEALIHALKRKGPEGFQSDENMTKIERVFLAMKVAEENHFIPQLIDPEDLFEGLDTISTMTLIGMIKNEYESGPEKRLEKKKHMAVIENSKFFPMENPNRGISIFTLELRNFLEELVPDTKDMKDIKIDAVFQPFDLSEDPSILNSEVAAISDGSYSVSILTDMPGTYEVTANFKEQQVGETLTFEIKKVQAKMICDHEIICRNNPGILKVVVEDEERHSKNNLIINFKTIFLKQKEEKEEEEKEEQKEKNERESVFTPNLEILNVKQTEENVFEVEFVGKLSGKYVVYGELYGQKLQNEITICIEDPIFCVKESPSNHYNVDEEQVLGITATDSKGNSIPFPEPRIVIRYVGDETELMDDTVDGKTNEIDEKPQEIGESVVEERLDEKVDDDPKVTNDENDTKTSENDTQMAENDKNDTQMAENDKKDTKTSENDKNDTKTSENDTQIAENDKNDTKTSENDTQMAENDQTVEEKAVLKTEEPKTPEKEAERQLETEQKTEELKTTEKTENQSIKDPNGSESKTDENESNFAEIESETAENKGKTAETAEIESETAENKIETAETAEIGPTASRDQSINENGSERQTAKNYSLKKNSNGFILAFVPEKCGKIMLEMFSSETGGTKLYEKTVDISYAASWQKTTIRIENEDEKVFEEISTAKIVIDPKTKLGREIPSREILKNPEAFVEQFELLWEVGARKSGTREESEVSVVSSIGVEGNGSLVIHFRTNVAGDYKIDLKINGEKMVGESCCLHVKRKPLWELEGTFTSGSPGQNQEIKLSHKDREGNPMESNDEIKCFVKEENGEALEVPVVGDLMVKTIVWETSTPGNFQSYIAVNDVKTYKFDNIIIKNPVEISLCELICASELPFEKEEINFKILLKDANGKLLPCGGDSKEITAAYQKMELNQTSISEETEIQKVTKINDNQDGTYSFSIQNLSYASYSILAKYQGEMIPFSPLTISVHPKIEENDVTPESIKNLEDDCVFFDYFCKIATTGVKAKKHRYTKRFLQKSQSEHIMNINLIRTKEAIFNYNKFSVLLTDISSVSKGKRTEVMKAATKIDPKKCFSLVTNKRTIDMEVSSEIERNVWVRGIRLHLLLNATSKNSRYHHLGEM